MDAIPEARSGLVADGCRPDPAQYAIGAEGEEARGPVRKGRGAEVLQ